MPHYVLDASVVIEYLVTGPYTPHASAFFTSITEDDRLWIPAFGHLECVNVLWKHVRFHSLPKNTALQLIKDLNALPLQIIPITALYEQAFEIGLEEELAIYDSVYIALAARMGCPLITVDQKQRRVAETRNIPIRPVEDFSS